MKFILLLSLFIQIASAQPRPTGNVLTDHERALYFEAIQKKEIDLISSLNKHVKKCYPSFEKQKSIPGLVTSYRLLALDKSDQNCSAEQITCLQDISSDIKKQGLSLLQGPLYKEYLHKRHQLSPIEIRFLIEDLKQWLKIKDDSDLKVPFYNKS